MELNLKDEVEKRKGLCVDTAQCIKRRSECVCHIEDALNKLLRALARSVMPAIGGFEMNQPILDDNERKAIRSMDLYWNEVAEREDRSPLQFEVQQLARMLGVKLLWIVEEYAKEDA